MDDRPDEMSAEYREGLRAGREVVCAVDGCASRHGLAFVMCGRCWSLVDEALQRRVYRAWGRRVRARDDATAAAHQAAKADAVAMASERLAAQLRPGQGTLL